MDNNINTPNLSNDNQNNVPSLNESTINNNFNQTVNDTGYVVNNYNPVGYMNNNGNNDNNKKNNTLVTILICFVIISVFVVGGYFVFKSLVKKAADTIIEDIEEETLPEDEFQLYDFSKYKNYRFSMNITIISNGTEIKTFSKGDADVKNKTDYMETTVNVSGNSKITYSYSDYNSGYGYVSSDDKNWSITSIEGTETIKLNDLIDKINDNVDVTKVGNDHYSVRLDYSSGDVVYNDVYADVHTAYGYISTINYDFTDLVSSEGISKFTVEITITDVNKNVSIVIPDYVKKGNSSI